MKNASNHWDLLQMLVYSSLAMTGLLLIIYGVYQFAAIILPSLLEAGQQAATL